MTAISGETGKMKVGFVRKSDKPYVMECGLEDVNLICNQERRFLLNGSQKTELILLRHLLIMHFR